MDKQRNDSIKVTDYSHLEIASFISINTRCCATLKPSANSHSIHKKKIQALVCMHYSHPYPINVEARPCRRPLSPPSMSLPIRARLCEGNDHYS